MKIRKSTLKAMMEDFGLASLSDKELDLLLPAVQAHREAIERLDRALDLSMVAPAAVFHAEPNR